MRAWEEDFWPEHGCVKTGLRRRSLNWRTTARSVQFIQFRRVSVKWMTIRALSRHLSSSTVSMDGDARRLGSYVWAHRLRFSTTASFTHCLAGVFFYHTVRQYGEVLSLLCVNFCHFCTLTDFSAAEKARGVKFCTCVGLVSGQVFSRFGEDWLAGSHGGGISSGMNIGIGSRLASCYGMR